MRLSIVPLFRSRRAVSNGGPHLSVGYDLTCFIKFVATPIPSPPQKSKSEVFFGGGCTLPNSIPCTRGWGRQRLLFHLYAVQPASPQTNKTIHSRSILDPSSDPSSIEPRSILDPSSFHPRIHPRSILDPSSFNSRSILEPSSIHPGNHPRSNFDP